MGRMKRFVFIAEDLVGTKLSFEFMGAEIEHFIVENGQMIELKCDTMSNYTKPLDDNDE